jgi:hypothetical protein
VISGRGESGGQLARVDRYDPVKNEWAKEGDIPLCRCLCQQQESVWDWQF